MPTTKKRINLTTDRDTEAILEKIARRDGMPMATKAAELLHFALGIEEDLALASIVESRMAMKVKRWIPHHLAWK